MLWLYLHFPHLVLDHIRRTREDEGALVEWMESMVICRLGEPQKWIPTLRTKAAAWLVWAGRE